MNRDAKTFHRIYNRMSFPDDTQRRARTVTATCTRVSRESIIVNDGSGGYRRLTVRERGCLQSFPAAYQFVGGAHSNRVKMIGNAVPPLLTYNIGMAFRQVSPDLVVVAQRLPDFATPVKSAVPPSPVRTFGEKRRFAAAVPGLRFGSGVRFELVNSLSVDGVEWAVNFVFGTSKDIRTIEMDDTLLTLLQGVRGLKGWSNAIGRQVRAQLTPFEQIDIQAVWTGRASGPSPFELVDQIALLAEGATRTLPKGVCPVEVLDVILGVDEGSRQSIHAKLSKNAGVVLGGLVVGSHVNCRLT